MGHFIYLPGEQPASLAQFAGLHSYSTGAGYGDRLSFGSGSLLTALMGNMMAPIPSPGTPEGIYDAMAQRQQSIQMMQIARNTVASWRPFQNLGGLNQNSLLSTVATSMMSNPDGIAATLMKPFLGGNPIQAQMAAFANLQGIGAAGLGKVTGTSIGELRGAADAFEKYFYNQQNTGIKLAPDSLKQITDAVEKGAKAGISKGTEDSFKITRGVNYTNTLGFSYENLMGARDEMIRNGLVGGKGFTDLIKISEQFGGSNNAGIPKLLDAARSAFGNDLSGKQLADRLSSFVGYSNYNLNTTAGQTALENNLRTLKATARVTGISYDTMLNVIGQAQGVAGSNPLLSHLGGAELGPMASEAALRTMVMASGMTGQDVRYLGGTANMFRSTIEGNLSSAGQGISTQLAAMHTYFQGNGTVQQAIRNYAVSGNKTAGGWQAFQESIARATGVNAVDMQRYTQYNPAATRYGFQDAPEILKAGGQAQVQGLLQGINLFYGNNSYGKYAAGLIRSGNFKQLLTDRRLNQGEFGPAWEDALSKGYLYDYAVANNSTFAKQDALLRNRVQSTILLDKTVSYHMGKMNAPTMQRMIQSLFSGDLKDKGISSMFESLGFSKDNTVTAGIMKNVDQIQKLTGANSIENLMLVSGAKGPAAKNVATFAALAQKFGIKSSAIQDILKAGPSADALKKLVANPANMDSASAQQLFTATQHMVNGGTLSGYVGDFSQGSIADFLKQPLVGATVDALGNTAQRNKGFNDMLMGWASDLQKGGGEGGQLGKAISSLGSNAWDVLNGIQSEAGMGYEKNKNGKYVLTGDTLKFGLGIGKDWGKEFDSEDAAKKAAETVQAIAGSNSTVTGLVGEKTQADADSQAIKDSAVKQASDMDGIKNGIASLVTQLQQINSTLTNM
jgi:hypothetical protein